MDSIIIEIRAGAGGEEAALFAKDLFNMYSKYAASQGWLVKILDTSATGIGGLKNSAFEIKGEGVYDKLKYEAGVHRVQRVPRTEKSNRVHTSTASVAVLKKAPEAEVSINPQDIKMDFFKSSGKGGQNVNKRQTAIRITHLPTGLVVSSQAQRNLEQNKKAAMDILRAQLYQIKQKALEGKVIEQRREQIGSQERAEKIRTYNFPQDRLTDHRINKSFHQIDKILNGKLDKVIDKLASEQQNKG